MDSLSEQVFYILPYSTETRTFTYGINLLCPFDHNIDRIVHYEKYDYMYLPVKILKGWKEALCLTEYYEIFLAVNPSMFHIQDLFLISNKYLRQNYYSYCQTILV